MKKVLFVFNFIIILCFFSGSSYLFSQNSGYKIIDKIIIGGDPEWDFLSVFKEGRELFVSHGTEVDVINLIDNSLAGKITGMKGVHGIAFDKETEKGFISDGDDNSIVIFDLKNLEIIITVKSTGKDPDAILYDPFSKMIFAFNGHDSTATVIDPVSNRVENTISLSGSPESGASDFNGHVFVNIEKKNKIDVIDSKTFKVTGSWLIPPLEKPTAMSIDRENNKLFIGARNKLFGVIDANTGKVIANFPIGSGVDACEYDPQTHLIFCSNKDATMSVIGQDSPDKYTFLENLSTLPKAKTVALDEETHRVYTTAMVSSGTEQTFGVLVLGRK